jgi:hypothetical protein
VLHEGSIPKIERITKRFAFDPWAGVDVPKGLERGCVVTTTGTPFGASVDGERCETCANAASGLERYLAREKCAVSRGHFRKLRMGANGLHATVFQVEDTVRLADAG